jgi:hypothetical protein
MRRAVVAIWQAAEAGGERAGLVAR